MNSVPVDPALLREAAELFQDCRIYINPEAFSDEELFASLRRRADTALFIRCATIADRLREAANQAGEARQKICYDWLWLSACDLVNAWKMKTPLAWQPENNPELLKALEKALEGCLVDEPESWKAMTTAASTPPPTDPYAAMDALIAELDKVIEKARKRVASINGGINNAQQ